MTGVLTGVVGALLGLTAVALGAWLQSRRERLGWLRDQKLRAAVEFTSATRYLINQYRAVGAQRMDQAERREWRHRMQNGRAALYLLCSEHVIALADELASALYATVPGDPEQADRTDELFRRMTVALRREIAAERNAKGGTGAVRAGASFSVSRPDFEA